MRIDEALHYIHNQPNLGLAVQEEIFRLSASTCPTADARSETKVDLSSQGGVFIIVGILILIAVTWEVGTALKNRKAVARAAQGDVVVEMEGEHAGDRERSIWANEHCNCCCAVHECVLLGCIAYVGAHRECPPTVPC